jgi:hypothetical protein
MEEGYSTARSISMLTDYERVLQAALREFEA